MAQRIAPDPVLDPSRLAAVSGCGLFDTGPEAEFDRLARLACAALGTERALIAIVTADRVFAKGGHGFGSAPIPVSPLAGRVCEAVVRDGAALIDDVRRDRRVAASPAAEESEALAWAAVPIHDPTGQTLGALCVAGGRPRAWTQADRRTLEDIAEVVRAELQLRASRAAARTAAALEQAQAVAGIGSWEWDPESGRLSCSPGLCRLLELDRAPTTRAEYEALIPAARRAELLAEALAGLGDDGRWEAEHRIARSDGSWRLIRSRGETRIGPDGLLHLVRGVAQDITAESEREAGFRAAFWDAPIGAALLGLVRAERGSWLSANQELERLLGAGPGGLAGRALEDVTHPEDQERLDLVLDRLARGEAERTRHEQRIRRPDGAWLAVAATHSVIRGPSGEPSYAVSHYVDVTLRERQDEELGAIAERDPLTGVLNRRRFTEELAGALSRSARSRSPGALFALDLDGLRHVNEAAGNAAGDRLLIRVAQSVASMLRAGDAVARTGDDEFAILLADADLGQAQRVAERLLRAVRHILRGTGAGAPPDATASIGLTTWGERPPPPTAHAFVEAETALYEAKSAGGDQYAVYPGPEETLGLDPDP
jgi:diguanylate cyclase (GGDEF)-like protein/PAS domain S-box-containing protein